MVELIPAMSSYAHEKTKTRRKRRKENVPKDYHTPFPSKAIHQPHLALHCSSSSSLSPSSPPSNSSSSSDSPKRRGRQRAPFPSAPSTPAHAASSPSAHRGGVQARREDGVSPHLHRAACQVGIKNLGGTSCVRGAVGMGARSGYVGRRRVRVMDYAAVNVERHAAAGGGTASDPRGAQESRSSGTGYYD